MPRWRQVKTENGYEMVEISSERSKPIHAIHGFFEPYQSPIDGSVISDNSSLRKHNDKHGVVHAQEFTPEHYERKRQEREREPTTAERFQRKQEIYENWNRVEQGYKPNIDQYNGE